jgi:S-adenosylmethionine:tRNA ribosyltransferase-isomerase
MSATDRRSGVHTSDFTYDLPDAAIAQRPIEPRDRARLLLADTLEDRVFADLPDVLERGDLVVVNRTRVRRARILARKAETGGRVEVLLLAPFGDDTWEALVRPARRLRAGAVVEAGGLQIELVADPVDGVARVRLDAGSASIEDAIHRAGTVPLPPYIHAEPPDPERYQTVYATSMGSAAAPTAGLHFTEAVLDRLGARGIDVAAVDLQIGVDTFRPITTERVEDHRMHTEAFTIGEETAAAVAAARGRGGRVVAIGTTVVRSLESAAAAGGLVEPRLGATDLFITPGFRFRVVDVLVTNYHVPGSSLVVLVAAFMGERWREAYRTALERGYRFLSFGDAMMATRAP